MADTNKNPLQLTATPSAESKITGSAQGRIDTIPKRFLVHFRRPHDYDGNYGFDWLQPEFENYVSSFRLRNEYNPTRLFGEGYLTPWLSIAIEQTVKINLVIQSLNDAITPSDNDIIRLPRQGNIRFVPEEIRVKDITENVKHFPTGEEKGVEVEVICDGAISSDTIVNVFNQNNKIIGRLSVLRNNNELVMPVRVVLLVREGYEEPDIRALTEHMTSRYGDFSDCSSISECMESLEKHMNTYAYNQAFIRCEMERDSNRQIIEYRITINEAEWKRKGYIDANGRIISGVNEARETALINELLEIYRTQVERGQRNRFRGVVMMITNFEAGRTEKRRNEDSNEYEEFSYITLGLGNLNVIDARNCIMFKNRFPNEDGNANKVTYIHEIGHVLSLAHPFQVWPSPEVRREREEHIARLNRFFEHPDVTEAERAREWLRHRDTFKRINRSLFLFSRNRYTFIGNGTARNPERGMTRTFMDYVEERRTDNRRFFTQRQWRTIQEAVRRFFSRR